MNNDNNNTKLNSSDYEDDYCDLDPTKICDNCFKCLILDNDYKAIQIDEIIEDNVQ